MEEDVYDNFVEKLVATIRDFYSDDPKNCRHYGRIISSRHVERIAGLLKATEGRIILGGDCDDSANHYVAPTLVEVSSGDDALMQEELFSPVLPILKVKTVDEAIGFVNKREKPLALYLFSRDEEIMKSVVEHTASGSVGINETMLQIIGGDSFLGGVGESGLGKYGGREGFETFSHKRPVMYSSSLYGRAFQVLLPNLYSTEDGKDNVKIAQVTRFLCKIPQTVSDQMTWVEKIRNTCALILSAVRAMCVGVPRSRRLTKD